MVYKPTSAIGTSSTPCGTRSYCSIGSRAGGKTRISDGQRDAPAPALSVLDQARAETVAFLRSIPGMAAGGARKARSAFFSLAFEGCSVRHCGSVFVTFTAPTGPSPGKRAVFVLQCEDCDGLRSTMRASTCPWLHVTTNVAPRARSSIHPSPVRRAYGPTKFGTRSSRPNQNRGFIRQVAAGRG